MGLGAGDRRIMQGMRVLLPHPVSPWMMVIRFSAIFFNILSLYSSMGSFVGFIGSGVTRVGCSNEGGGSVGLSMLVPLWCTVVDGTCATLDRSLRLLGSN